MVLFHRVSFSVADDGAEVEVVRHFTESIYVISLLFMNARMI